MTRTVDRYSLAAALLTSGAAFGYEGTGWKNANEIADAILAALPDEPEAEVAAYRARLAEGVRGLRSVPLDDEHQADDIAHLVREVVDLALEAVLRLIEETPA